MDKDGGTDIHVLTPCRSAPYLEDLPFDADTKRRIRMTIACSDTASIPKVDRAGEVFEENGRRVQLMHNGVRVLEDCYYGKWMTELIRLLQGHHEPQEEKVFHQLLTYLPRRATMIELGSFWGYYSLWFQQAVPEASTFMIEPDPNNLEIGRQNFRLNGRSGKFFNCSVARESGPAEPFKCESDGQVRPIPKISVDDFIQQNKIDLVDLLLADIQGAELQMLEGARASMAQRKIRFALISTHHHSISSDPLTHQRCLQFLQGFNARIIAAHSVSESYSGDGLIAVTFSANDDDVLPVEISKNHASNSLFREVEFDLADAEDRITSLNKRVETLQDTIAREREKSAMAEARMDQLQRVIAEKDELVLKLLHSTSWKITKPVRLVGGWLRMLDGCVSPVRLRFTRTLAARRVVERLRTFCWQILTAFPEHNLTVRTGQGRFSFSNKDREIGRQLFVKRNFDFEKVAIVKQLFSDLGLVRQNRDGYLVDIGAHVGTVCISLVRGGVFRRALAFEPAPRNFSLLTKNVRQNDLADAIRPFNLALSMKDSLVAMELSDENYGDHRVRMQDPAVFTNEQFTESRRRVLKIPARRLDDILCQIGVEPEQIGLLWLDVQGHEQYVLEGAQSVVRARVPVVTEFWPYGLFRAGVSPDSFARYMSSHFDWFYDLSSNPLVKHPVTEINDLFSRYTGISFTDLFLIRN